MRNVPRVMLLLLLLPLLSACGWLGSNPLQAPEPPPRPPVFSEPTNTPPPAASPTPPAPNATLPASIGATAPLTGTPALELVLWTTETGGNLEQVRRHSASFSLLAGVSITVVAQTNGGIRANLLAAQLVGQGVPDLIWADQDVLGELLIDRQIQPAPLPTDLNSFALPARVGATAEGQLWGVPLLMYDTMLLLHNRQLSDTPPATSDDLIRLSRAIATPADAPPRGIVARWQAARWLLPWLNGFGGSPTSPDGQQPTLDTEPMANSLNLLRELVQAAPAPDDFDTGQSRFLAGEIGFLLDGDWSLSSYQQSQLAADLGIAQMPTVPATGRLAAATVDTAYLMVLQDVSATGVARSREFAAYLTTPQIQAELAQSMVRAPAVLAASTNPLIQNDPLLALLSAQAQAGLGIPPTRAYRCAMVAIETQLPLISNSDMPADEIAAAMQRQANQCVVTAGAS